MVFGTDSLVWGYFGSEMAKQDLESVGGDLISDLFNDWAVGPGFFLAISVTGVEVLVFWRRGGMCGDRWLAVSMEDIEVGQ